MRTLLRTIAIFGLIQATARGQVPEYTPEQVMSMLDQKIRATFGYPPSGSLNTNPPTWLSLTYVGLEIPEDDQKAIDLLAVQCPPADQTLGSFSSAHRLDQVYEQILNRSALSQQQVVVPGLAEAIAKLYVPDRKPPKKTPEYEAYREFDIMYRDEVALLAEAQKAGDRVQERKSLNKIKIINEDWITEGSKKEIEAALEKVKADAAIGAELNTAWRREILTDYRLMADPAPASLVPPRSYLHPAPSKWAGNAGWTTVKFEKKDSWSETEEKYRKETRYGSAGGGFLFWRASVSGSRVEERKENRNESKASSVSFSFDVRRAVINREWFDQRFLFQPGFWTWLKPESTGPGQPLPLISRGEENGMPVENANATYLDFKIPIPVVPTEVVVARNLTLTATVSKTLYNRMEELSKSDASASGRGFFFFSLRGGGSNEAKLTKVNEAGDSVTFQLSTAGPVVIGFISQVVPVTPAPKLDRPWPKEAWLPQ